MAEGDTLCKITLQEARDEFLNILRRLGDHKDTKNFISWIEWNWINTSAIPKDDMPDEILKAIAVDIRAQLPPSAILPSEQINIPVTGSLSDSDCDPRHTLHVDAFLYDDEQVDELCERGELDRNYCLQCGSHKTKPLSFISHSVSRERVKFIFTAMLPPIDCNKVVLDIGSRLGAVLYGAFFYTNSARIIGIEMNGDFCNLQREIIKKFGFQDRISVLHTDIVMAPEVVQSSNVVIMNNVFECFLPLEQQAAIWRFLRQMLVPGTVLVTSPSLETTFLHLETGINLSEWVQELTLHDPDAPGISDISNEMEQVKHYQIL